MGVISFANRIIKSIRPKDRARFLSNIFPGWRFGREWVSQGNVDSMIHAYVSWVYIAASKNSQTVASIPLRLFVARKSKNSKMICQTKAITKDHKDFLYSQASLQDFTRKSMDIEEVIEHPYHEMMRNVNRFTNQFGLWEITQVYQELVGTAYWYILLDPVTKIPGELYIVMPQFMRILVTKEDLIGNFIYKTGQQKVVFEPEEIVMFKMGNPLNPYLTGYSPLMAVTDAFNVSKNIHIYENANFANGGMPAGLLTTDRPMGDDVENERIKSEWADTFGGSNNSGKIAFLSKGTSFQALSLSPRDLGFLKGREVTKDEIMSAFGQTEAMRKATSLADKTAANRSYRAETILPRTTRNQETMNEQLIPLYNDPTLFVAYDNPVPEDKVFEMTRRTSDLNAGITAINQERAKLGMEPVEGGDEPLVGAGKIPLSMAALGGGAPFPQTPDGAKDINEIIVRQMIDKMF